ncbi:uncharacterized protein LOC113239012 [Hyposmocoma kahamanoa]|uniref:uncharacterized protein LOC113239012 n=1 Tax=Hyposmocoma kahamanoa TaxID=1477025 RepID=UPI000E6D6130|nr:uncharacterized protein LOC113239012 [Hyposmocoma kahamanoa]
MEEIRIIPNEILKLIPQFSGDRRQLSLFIRRCEYVIHRFRGGDSQNEYVLHALTSRLTNDASALISERDDLHTWLGIKDLLIQHFGDPRSEECIAIELETLKIRHGEGYGDFCKRIQSVRSNLIAKVNLITDDDLKRSKLIIYNDMALKVFLFNLSEKMVRNVRLHSPDTLEDALKIVLEEVDFLEQYQLKNKMTSSTNPRITTPHHGYRPQLRATQTPMRPQDFGRQQNRPNNANNSGDVSMRTAPPQRYQQQQGFRLNELELNNNELYFDDNYVESYPEGPCVEDTYSEETPLALPETPYNNTENPISIDFDNNAEKPQNFTLAPVKNDYR